MPLSNKLQIFLPNRWLALLTILGIALFIFLGNWQLHRYAYKKNLQTGYEAHRQTVLSLQQLEKIAGDQRFYSVTVSGHFINERNLLIDNKVYRGQAGYEVISLFIPEGSKQVLLVNRGFIKAEADRNKLPAIPAISQVVNLRGMSTIPAAHPFVLGDPIERPIRWPLRMEALIPSEVSNITGYTLYPFVIKLGSGTPGALQVNDQIDLPNPYTSLGYAYQWFAFALTLFIIYIVLCFRNRKIEK